MSDEYSIATNFQRASDDPRAAAEYEYRMARLEGLVPIRWLSAEDVRQRMEPDGSDDIRFTEL